MKNIVIAFVFLLLISCNHKENNNYIVNNDIVGSFRCSENLGQAVIWYQRSPEMYASYIQGYNIAKRSLENNLAHKKYKQKKNAVVLDLDETVLDNSPYEAWLYDNNKIFESATWNNWVQDEDAELVPGVADFLRYANTSGCEIFYVSNRNKHTQTEATLNNLRKFDLPCSDTFHLLLKDTTITGDSGKERRRRLIEDEYNFEILLLCGDQVADYDKAFDAVRGLSESQVKDSLNKYSDFFGSRFVIMPNPMYSDWLNKNIIGNGTVTDCNVSDSLRKIKLKRWK